MVQNLFDDIIAVLKLIIYVSTFNAFNFYKDRKHIVELRSHIGVKSSKDVILGYKQNSGFAKILQNRNQL